MTPADRLTTARTELAAAHEQLHHDNNTSHQRDPHLREAVSAAAAALAAVDRAIGHVQAYTLDTQQTRDAER